MQDPTKPLRFVSVTDPALDWRAMNVHKYAETRDEEALRFLPGVEPAWWEVRPLDVDQWASVEETSSPNRRLIQCVMHALVSVTVERIAWRPSRVVKTGERAGTEITICSHDEMTYLFETFGGARLYEIGAVIYERASVGKAQSGGALYTLPPSLLDELAAAGRRHAARILEESKTKT